MHTNHLKFEYTGWKTTDYDLGNDVAIGFDV